MTDRAFPRVVSDEFVDGFRSRAFARLIDEASSPPSPDVFDRWVAGEFDVPPRLAAELPVRHEGPYARASRINDPKGWTNHA